MTDKSGNGNDKKPPKDAEDYANLWKDPDLGDGITEVKRSKIAVSKPRDFFRVHPDKAFRRRTEIYVHKPEGQIDEQTYILAPELWGKLEEANEATLVAVVYRDGTPRLWALKVPKDGERDNNAWSTARDAARAAISKWVKIVWSGGVYITREAKPGYAPEPDWSKLPDWDELIRLGFGEHGVIRDESHPVYRDLFGEGPEGGGDEDL
jgi:hypothetical protein